MLVFTLYSISINDWKDLAKNENAEEYFPNGLKVSKPENPMYFPVEYTYQIGSAEILALMSNTIAIGTGQTGAAPLYVFCKDGVYALFVDASGQMTYSNSRVLARDVCNNPRSVTPIDAGVVFTTDRGLMMIAGEQVEEIGQPAEGDVLHYTNVNGQGVPLSVEGSKIATDALTKIAGLPSSLCDTTDFLTYLQGAIVNYNYNMRELIVTNPNKSYSYVLDREGNWSRRDYTAVQYVNNYPTSYRVEEEEPGVCKFYKLDDEGNSETSLEHRKEADNQIFYLSNVIKLDSIGFKQANRFVVRGYFETQKKGEWEVVGRLSTSSPMELSFLTWTSQYEAVYPFDKIQIGDKIKVGSQLRMVTNKEILSTAGTDTPISSPIGGQLGGMIGNLIGGGSQTDLSFKVLTLSSSINIGFEGQTVEIYRTDVPCHVGIVVEGSYDGKKFSPLGYNRKSGKFTNIGCLVERTDVRFFRVCLAGQVTGKTRIKYMEMSASGSVLNSKIR